MAQHPPVGQGILNVEGSRSHSDTPHLVGLLLTRDYYYKSAIYLNSGVNNIL